MFVSYSEVFAEALCSGDYSLCLAELELVPVSSLWPKNNTLRALASLLTADDPHVNKVAASYLSSGASRGHFRTRVSSAIEDVRRVIPALAVKPWCIRCCMSCLKRARVSTGRGLLHPGAVGGWSSEPEGGLFSSQLSPGQWLLKLSIVCVLFSRYMIL